MLVARFHPPLAGSMRRARSGERFPDGDRNECSSEHPCGPPPMGSPPPLPIYAVERPHSDHSNCFVFSKTEHFTSVYLVDIAKIVVTLVNFIDTWQPRTRRNGTKNSPPCPPTS